MKHKFWSHGKIRLGVLCQRIVEVRRSLVPQTDERVKAFHVQDYGHAGNLVGEQTVKKRIDGVVGTEVHWNVVNDDRLVLGARTRKPLVAVFDVLTPKLPDEEEANKREIVGGSHVKPKCYRAGFYVCHGHAHVIGHADAVWR